ncbi:phosphoribosyl-AMP cyclohydrolase [Pilibacter termitis]|uniref:Phosphoribosyl-AMP cyclohydrolase n=1 Tax=Pilibacter termitis TaxID=263852 RepID=A0A1T4LQ78_9ENTE|nr:phosphoribosyl-AMP cyclohydrolase [Pilibacter termitis]SJZ56880.1 phosphoribosyl-AMP cyclohydrolase [Pilibacter termitis]
MSTKTNYSLDFDKQGGLIPTIIIDDVTKEVLMLAYMNEESFQKTLETKQTWFYSRSRNELWHKGATSGAFQNVKTIKADCDCDTLLISVEQIGGAACHTGATSCFFNEIE